MTEPETETGDKAESGADLTGLTPKKALIVKMRETGATWVEIATAHQCTRETLWHWRKNDKAFADACAAADELGIDAIESALHVASLKVATDPRFTTAAIFSLKNRRPDKWRDVKDVRHSGAVKLAHMSIEELERMAHTLDEDKGE